MTQIEPRQLADPTRDGTVFVRDLGAPAAPPEVPALPGMWLFVPTADDVPALEDAMHSSGLYPPDVASARLRAGRRPYALETDGLIATFGWAAFSAEPVGDLGISFRVKPGEAYIYDCATRAEYRGRGFYPTLLRFMAADLYREGRRRLWIATAPGNEPSQRGIVRAGFMKVADVHMRRGPDDVFHPELYGVPGVQADLLAQAAWAYLGRALPDTGIPLSRTHG